ncbi:Retrovirus-related Pol polyprotein from transposon 412 [Merluccius polli]|uniref:Gypsy retrotransposon integrase-like protein 1 n=1 Tax=Merluccius polli TaxID=89951 RepID=A0AA47M1V2_MERPO|nr:Retrovirus-related Pol polyprotein from transposon 412 [Merluccius polli]
MACPFLEDVLDEEALILRRAFKHERSDPLAFGDDYLNERFRFSVTMSTFQAFLDAPSEALLAVFTKTELSSLAEHYNIDTTLAKGAKKEQLYDLIRTGLINRGVLSGEKKSERSNSHDELAPSSKPKMSEFTFEQQVELLKLQHDLQQEIARKKLDEELAKNRLDKELDRQRFDAVQKDKDRELELERLKNQEQERDIERTRLQLIAAGKLGRSPSQQSSLASMIKFLPKFNEREPEVFFSLFENVATEQNWSDEDKTVLLQTALVGRAQRAFVALPSSEKKVYRCVKAAVLKCYELVPEAYRQRFRSWQKSDKQTYAEWASDLTNFFHRWLTSEDVDTFDGLCDLMILEQLKNTLPDRIATYINEHKVKSATDGAVLADNYSLIHKIPAREFSPRSTSNYRERRYSRVNTDSFSNSVGQGKPSDFDPKQDCNYCFGKNHWKKDCPVLMERNMKGGRGKVGLCASSGPAWRSGSKSEKTPTKTVNCAQCTVSVEKDPSTTHCEQSELYSSSIADYAPFVTEGFVSLTGDTHRVPVKILRDTGASESFICQSVLPFSDESDTGNCVLIRGIGLQSFPVPLHKVHLFSGFVNGEVTIAVRPSLPIEGIDLIVGNNFAHNCVFPDQVSPTPVVRTEAYVLDESDVSQKDFLDVFTACAVTCAMARKQDAESSEVSKNTSARIYIPQLPESLSRSDIAEAQNDQSLKKYFELAADDSLEHGYIVNDCLLLRRWSPTADTDMRGQVLQVVMPEKFREVVLQTAHGEAAGHFGVKKTYNQLLQHCYWPRIKRDVARFVKTCHVCQVAGKQNTITKPAPLQPIPSVGKPFEHLVIDCVGPLPQSKSGCVYLFTIMCQATRYPAAFALRTITTRSVVKCLSQFFSIFGLPRVIQSDPGSNFTSKTFTAALKELHVQHNLSSAYHPQSQGVLERFHATLKALLRTYCVEMTQDWEDGLPWLLLAARTVVQESTGFSPNELVFGHKVRTPLFVLSDFNSSEPPESLSTYVLGFRRRLLLACKMATENLTEAQSRMKRHYDRKAERRVFSPGDQVVALLPIPGSPFTAKYSGPYSVVRKVSETNYVVATPGRRRATQLCHINLLKPYYASVQPPSGKAERSVLIMASTALASPAREEDDVHGPDDSILHACLNNSETLTKLEGVLSHLDVQQQQ